MRLYIIRHGITLWNKTRRMQGRTDIPLAEEGLELAVRTGRGMAEVPIDLVISSPLCRAVETAGALMRGKYGSELPEGLQGKDIWEKLRIPFMTDARIQEISFGEWEGECVLDSQVLPKDYLDAFYHDPLHIPRAPGGETFSQVRERTGAFLEELSSRKEYKDKNILVSTHGAAGRCLLSHFFEDGAENIWRTGVPANCSVSIVEIKDGRKTVIELDKLYA